MFYVRWGKSYLARKQVGKILPFNDDRGGPIYKTIFTVMDADISIKIEEGKYQPYEV